MRTRTLITLPTTQKTHVAFYKHLCFQTRRMASVSPNHNGSVLAVSKRNQGEFGQELHPGTVGLQYTRVLRIQLEILVRTFTLVRVDLLKVSTRFGHEEQHCNILNVFCLRHTDHIHAGNGPTLWLTDHGNYSSDL